MISSLELVTLRGPQFMSDPRLTSMIAYVSTTLSSNLYGERLGEAVGLKVLHILTMEQMSGGSAPGTGTSSGTATGGVSSKSEGDLSISFATNQYISQTAGRFLDLTSTAFGLELIALTRACSICFRNSTI